MPAIDRRCSIAEEVSELGVERHLPLGLDGRDAAVGPHDARAATAPDAVLDTDGLTEMRLRPGASERVGVERLGAKLAARKAALDSRALAELTAVLAADSGEEPFDDDLAVIAVSRVPPDGSSAGTLACAAGASGAA